MLRAMRCFALSFAALAAGVTLAGCSKGVPPTGGGKAALATSNVNSLVENQPPGSATADVEPLHPGFGAARWGMSQAEVRRLLPDEFIGDDDSIATFDEHSDPGDYFRFPTRLGFFQDQLYWVEDRPPIDLQADPGAFDRKRAAMDRRHGAGEDAMPGDAYLAIGWNDGTTRETLVKIVTPEEWTPHLSVRRVNVKLWEQARNALGLGSDQARELDAACPASATHSDPVSVPALEELLEPLRWGMTEREAQRAWPALAWRHYAAGVLVADTDFGGYLGQGMVGLQFRAGRLASFVLTTEPYDEGRDQR